MPSKKKGSKSKSAGLGGILDGVDTTQMNRDQLEAFARRIKNENEREREERNFFQLERDKLRSFWEITKSELNEVRAELRNKDRQIEEEDEKNEEEVKFYKQKVKLLQYEHQNNLTEAKAEAMVALKLAQDEHIAQERELIQSTSELKKQLREQEVSHLEKIKSFNLQHSRDISELRKESEKRFNETVLKYEYKCSELMRELEIKHKMEMSEIEERKNCQILELTKNHERAFNDMKTYYNDITLNNLALISSLKDEMEVLKNQNEKMMKEVSNLSIENRKLGEPLKQAEAKVEDYKKQLQNYNMDKLSLANVKAKLQDTKKELSDLRWSNEALELRFENLQVEKNGLYKKFLSAVLEIQQKTDLKYSILRKQIGDLNNMVKYYEAIFEELMATGEIPQHVNSKLEKMLCNKSSIIKDLQVELIDAVKSYEELQD